MKKFSLFFHSASRHIEPRSTPKKKSVPCMSECVYIPSALETFFFAALLPFAEKFSFNEMQTHP